MSESWSCNSDMRQSEISRPESGFFAFFKVSTIAVSVMLRDLFVRCDNARHFRHFSYNPDHHEPELEFRSRLVSLEASKF